MEWPRRLLPDAAMATLAEHRNCVALAAVVASYRRSGSHYGAPAAFELPLGYGAGRLGVLRG